MDSYMISGLKSGSAQSLSLRKALFRAFSLRL
jgi:hypothetical protein